jgi:hypothetical protein
VSEHVFQNLFMVQLSKDKNIRVFRQNSGKILTKHNTAIQGAPTGASDISGIVAPEGWRLEIECKEKESVSKAQQHWVDFIQEYGGIALVIRHTESTYEASVKKAVSEVYRAIAERRARK